MRQRKRKLEAIKGNTVKALSFTESYGLTADTLTKVKAARWEFNKTVEQFSIPTFDGSYRHVEMAIREEITRLVSVFTNISNIWTVCLAKRKVMLAWK